jgi:hypothetical protein
MSFIKCKQRSFARFQLLLRELGSLVMERILPSADEETALTTRRSREVEPDVVARRFTPQP